MEIEALLQLSQSGVAGVALYVSYQLWGTVKQKDIRNDDLQMQLLTAFTEQSRINAGLKESIDNNTKATENLSNSLFRYLIEKEKSENSNRERDFK